MTAWYCWTVRRCGVNQWSEHENTAREVNPRLSGDLSTPATLKVGMFLTSTVTQADAYLEKRGSVRGVVSAHPHINSRFQSCQ